jgi:hypothetical protein
MPTIEVKIQNLKELIFNLKRYPVISVKWLQKAIIASAAELQKVAIRGIVPWRTGRLAQSFQVEIRKLFAKIYPNVNYAIYVHEGTRPHLILPRIKEALYWEGARYPVKKVNHPGTQANRFLERMVKLAEPKILKHFKDAGDNILKEIAKT